MRGISYWFMVLAVTSVTLGMVWGIQMSITHDHALSPAHAHLNLLGWVTLGLFALYYHLVPAAAQSWLARLHFGLAAVGLVLIVPGIVMALTERGETLAAAGSMITLASMLVFFVVVLRHRKGANEASAPVWSGQATSN